MRKEIKYIGFYSPLETINTRACSLAATNKMNYISNALNRAGFDVHIISPAWIIGSEVKWQKKTEKVEIGKRVTLCPSFGTKYRVATITKVLFSLFWLFCYVLLNTKRGEQILVYHSPLLSIPIRIAKFFKRFELILEVEEIYADIWNLRNFMKKAEKKIINIADKYIVASDILRRNLAEKPVIVLYGSYTVDDNDVENSYSGLINVVYAGSIEHIRDGAYRSVESARYLGPEYLVNILGFGQRDDVLQLQKLIDDINNTTGREACIFHGTKVGEEFSSFLNRCSIAINPQKQGKYMDSAFPSKLLTYLSHNLRVVSTRIQSVYQSSLSQFITFSESDNPESIAKAINSIDLSEDFDAKHKLEDLDRQFVDDIKSFLSD